jgi:nucleotide-binding universal stress UspA family protein
MQLYGRIVLGFDGTEQAHDALTLSELLAGGVAGSLVPTFVVQHQPPFVEQSRDHVKMVRTRTHEVLEEARHALAEGLVAEVRSIVAGSPARGLYDAAEEEGASLIVIGSTHLGPLGRVLIGSAGEMLLAGTPRAVAVAPRGFRDRKPGSIRVVGFGYSGSDESHGALAAAKALAHAAGARLRAVTVTEDFVHARHPRPDAPSRPDLEQALEASATDAEIVSVAGDPSAQLANAAAEVDVMVVGSRGYGPMRHVLLGSVSAKLMRTCPAPLLVVPRGWHVTS